MPPTLADIKKTGCTIDHIGGKHIMPVWTITVWVEFSTHRWKAKLKDMWPGDDKGFLKVTKQCGKWLEELKREVKRSQQNQ